MTRRALSCLGTISPPGCKQRHRAVGPAASSAVGHSRNETVGASKGLGRIPEHVVEQVRERVDAVEVVRRYVDLKKSGTRFWGLCPFHTEKTPSFQVHPERQIFHCFGCGEGGDVFAFLMRHDNLSFPEAIRALAQQAGVTIPEQGDDGRLAPLYRANEHALEYFRESLRGNDGRVGRAYLERRNVPADLAERFQIGFAPAGWDGLLGRLKKHQETKAGLDAGLVAERRTGDGHYDRFRERIVFPIVEPGGRIVGFGGRAMGDSTPKYLNSPESPVYRKSRVLFGLSLAVDAIRQKERAVVVEGYFDLIALHRAGIAEGVAPCGTALTSDHARRLRRYTREVVLLFDGDAAGQAAAERSLPVLAAEGLRVLGAFLPEGEDPDTLLERQGEGALRACVDQAVPLLDHLIERRLLSSAQGAWDAADRARDLAPLVAALPSAIERESTVRKIASLLDLSPASVAAELSSVRTHTGGARAEAAPVASPAAPLELDTIARTLVESLCTHPTLVDHVDRLDAASLPTGHGAALLVTLCQALRERGGGAVAHLVSPAADELPPELKHVLSGVTSRATTATFEQAERAVADCIARLRIQSLDRESGSINLRLESCTEASEIDDLLELKQQNSKERSALWSQVHHL